MPCCSEIKRSDYTKSSENILDYIFKITFIIASSLLIMVIFPLRRFFLSVDILYSSSAFFSRKFLGDIHNAIINLNSAKINCRITARLHLVSPRLAGFLYRNYGYIVIIMVMAIISGISAGVFLHVN